MLKIHCGGEEGDEERATKGPRYGQTIFGEILLKNIGKPDIIGAYFLIYGRNFYPKRFFVCSANHCPQHLYEAKYLSINL